MTRRRADVVVGIVLLAVLAIGGTLSWQAYQRRRALDQMMGGGAMGSGGWGLFGGTMGLLWMGLLLAVPAYLGYLLVTRGTDDGDDEPLTILRERYARGELSDEEFERRRQQLP